MTLAMASNGSAKKPGTVAFGTRTEIMTRLYVVGGVVRTPELNALLSAFASKLAGTKKDAHGIYQDWLSAEMQCINERAYTASSILAAGRRFDVVVRAIVPIQLADETIGLRRLTEEQVQNQPRF